MHPQERRTPRQLPPLNGSRERDLNSVFRGTVVEEQEPGEPDQPIAVGDDECLEVSLLIEPHAPLEGDSAAKGGSARPHPAARTSPFLTRGRFMDKRIDLSSLGHLPLPPCDISS